MALGFKIADGYVEVHADYDRSELRDAAEDAADDFDTAFNRRRGRNSAANRRAGQIAYLDFVKGIQDQIGREKHHPFLPNFTSAARLQYNEIGRLAAVEAARGVGKNFDLEIRKHAASFQRAGVRVARGMRDGLIGRDGAGVAAAAFVTRFVEAVSLGMADLRASNIGGNLSRSFARIGTTVGLALATFLIAKAAQYITAAIPLLLGALAIIPIKFLAKTDKEVKKSIKGLKAEWKSLMEFVSSNIKPGLLKALENIKDGLNNLRVPLARFFKAIGDALPALSEGGMKAIENFFRALSNPAVTAGLKEWGRQLPGIGTALGQMVSAILKDPETTISTVKSLATDLKTLADAAGEIISTLAQFARWWDQMTAAIDRFEQATGTGAGGPLGGMFAAIQRGWTTVKPVLDGVLGWFRDLPGKISGFFQTIVDKMGGLPSSMGAKLATLPFVIMQPFIKAAAGAQAKTQELVSKVAAFLATLPGKAKAAVSNLWSSISGAFTTATSRAKTAATNLVNGVINFLKTLPGKARSAVSNLWGSMASTFSTAVSRAKTAATQLVNGFISIARTIVAKARQAVSGVRGAITGAFAGAGSWLVGAGRSIINGLASGIRSAVSGAVAAAASAARAALNAAKAAIGISSPSKAFAEEVGVPAAQGIAVGLRDRFPEEMKGLRKALPQLRLPEPAMAGMAGSSGAGSGFNPTINLYMQPGFYSENAAAKRALTKDVYLALEQYRKDYVSN